MLDFTKRVLAAAWARFAPNVVVALKGFGSATFVLAAVWVAFAPSGLVEAWRWISRNVLWLQLGHVLHSISLSF